METLCAHFVSLAFGMLTTIGPADAIKGPEASEIQAILTPMAERIRLLPLPYSDAAAANAMDLFLTVNRSNLKPPIAGAYKMLKAIH